MSAVFFLFYFYLENKSKTLCSIHVLCSKYSPVSISILGMCRNLLTISLVLLLFGTNSHISFPSDFFTMYLYGTLLPSCSRDLGMDTQVFSKTYWSSTFLQYIISTFGMVIHFAGSTGVGQYCVLK